ncbi:PTS sugar transporter subunit IIB [bacterium]|nr:PTS sugar transporter subunit IIB [bacterium]
MSKQLLIARIDDRLIHGQVVVGWGRVIGFQLYIVINDEVAKDKTQQNLIKIAIPVEAKVLIFSIEEAIEKLTRVVKNKRAMLLFSNPTDVLKVIKGGFKICSVNLGGLRKSEKKREILPTVFLDNEKIEVFKELSLLGIEIEYRLLPGDEKVDFMEVLKNGKFI